MRISVVLLVLCIGAAHGRDINRQRYPLGERASGMGGVVIGLPGDPVATYYNPAGLPATTSQGLSLSASAYQLSSDHYANALDVELDDGRLQADMESLVFSTFPSSIVYALPVDDARTHWLAFSVLVPDYDRVRMALDEPVGAFAFEFKGLFRREDVTYWIGPSWGASFGDLRLGVSVFGLVHLASANNQVGLKVGLDDGAGGTENRYVTVVQEINARSMTAVAEVGVQYDVVPGLTLGAVVRSPTLGTLDSAVEAVYFGSGYSEDEAGQPTVSGDDPGYVDRIETESGEYHYSLPLMVGLGVGYTADGWAAGFDVSWHAELGPYDLVSGAPVQPEDASGVPIADADRDLDIRQQRKTKATVNANVGGELEVSDSALVRLGLFTDQSVVDEAFYDTLARRTASMELPAVDRFGVSFAVGLTGENSTTSIGFIYARGTGRAWNFDEIFPEEEPQRTRVVSQSLTAVLAGSADL